MTGSGRRAPRRRWPLLRSARQALLLTVVYAAVGVLTLVLAAGRGNAVMVVVGLLWLVLAALFAASGLAHRRRGSAPVPPADP